MHHDPITGLIEQAEFIASPNCDEREDGAVPEAIILHCISLPPGEYADAGTVDKVAGKKEAVSHKNGKKGTASDTAISRFFCNRLNPNEHPYYETMAHLTVSSHFLIQRSGRLIQYVPSHLRAWHAGESVCLGRPKVNNFSIGIELEGLDTDANGYTDAQYATLQRLVSVLCEVYPRIEQNNVFAHSDIAPGRKPDPGRYFDWARLRYRPSKLSR